MGNLHSRLTVSLVDDVSDRAKKVGAALKNATDQVQKLAKAGVSDRFAQQLSKFGLSAKEIDKVTAAWRSYSSGQGLAARSSDWTKSQTAQVKTWENATISALRNVKRAQQTYQSSRPSGGAMIAGAAGVGAAALSGHKAKEFGKKAVVSVSEFDIVVRKQREFVDISKDVQERLIEQAKRIGQDTQYTNADVVKAQTKAMQGLPAEFDARLRGEVGAGIIESVKNYALVMEADLERSSEGIRTFLQTTNKDISSKEKAVAAATRATNLVVKMAKLGGMSDEDVQQFMKFGAATGTAAGLSDTTLAALGSVGRRGGLRGDELGVFIRAISSKLVAPTSKGLDALTVAGIKYNDFTKMPGGLSTDNLEAFSKRRFGKGLSGDQRSRLSDILEDSEVVSNKEDFTKQVATILEEGFQKKKDGTTKAKDANSIAKMVGDFHKLSTESVDSEGLLNAIMTNPKMSIALLNAMFTDKHGGKGSIIAKKWGEFATNKAELDKVTQDPEFAKRKADEIMGGIGGSFERLKGSIENLTLSVGQAHETMLKLGMDTAGGVLDSISNAPPKALAWGSGIAASAGALGGSLLTRSMLERFGILGAGSGAAGLAGGLAIGGLTGAAMSDLAKDVIKAHPEQAKSLLQNSMLGALSGDAALAAGILNAPYVPAGPPSNNRKENDFNFGDMARGDVWSGGADPIKHLDQSAKASAAGEKTGEAYKSSIQGALNGVDAMIDAAVQRWVGKLSFSASPQIKPNFSEPSGGAYPRSRASIDPVAAKHAAFADTGFG